MAVMHQTLDRRRRPDLVVAPGDPRLPIEGWDRLAADSGGSYFQTGTWSLAWWETLAGRPETRIGLWFDADGDLEALCAISLLTQPLLRSSGPAVRTWVNTGSGAGAGDHLGWPGYRTHGPAMLDWALSSTSGPMILSNLDPGLSEGLSDRGFRLVGESPTLAVELGQGDSWFPGSTDFRKKLRYAERQLAKAGVTLAMVGPGSIDRALFERLLRLHSVRSDEMGWESSFDENREAFHRRLIDCAGDDFGPMACVATTADEVVGVLYGFRFGTTFAYYQTGWSQEYVRHSLGSVLVAHAMQHAAETGATRFDFLRGDDAYKRRFGAQPRADQTWALQRGMGGVAIGVRRRAVDALKARRR